LATAQKSALQHLIAATEDPQDLNVLKQALASVASGGSGIQPQPSQTTSPSASASDVTGVWSGQLIGPDGNPHTLTFDLKAEANKITGTISGAPPTGAAQPIVKGKIEGNQFLCEINAEGPDGNAVMLSFSGKIVGNQMQGAMSSPMGSLSFSVTRK
jgi:hypothetical protein